MEERQKVRLFVGHSGHRTCMLMMILVMLGMLHFCCTGDEMCMVFCCFG